MPKKKQCRQCRLYIQDDERCSDSTGLESKTCKKFERGHPYEPQHNDQVAELPDFNPEEPNCFAFWTGDQVLLLAWELDHNDRGSWTIRFLGLDDDGIVTKQYSRKEKAPAFHGEIRIRGVGHNDLFASFGHQDPDIVDQDDNVTNKPKEIKIFPHRDD